MLDEYLAIESGHMLIDNIRAMGYQIYTDISTDREIVFKHGHPIKARKITPHRTQITLDYALQSKPGFFFESLNEESYREFNRLFEELTGT